jgi:hypothetical protein
MVLRAALASAPVILLCIGAVVLFLRTRSFATLLQLSGVMCLLAVVLVHLCEAFQWLPWMGWGATNSPGHYLDLGSAVLGGVLFPVGYLLHALSRRGKTP